MGVASFASVAINDVDTVHACVCVMHSDVCDLRAIDTERETIVRVCEITPEMFIVFFSYLPRHSATIAPNVWEETSGH